MSSFSSLVSWAQTSSGTMTASEDMIFKVLDA